MPKGVTVEYLDADDQWQPFGVAQTPLVADAETTVTAETPVTTTSLRAVLDYGTGGGYSKVTEASFGIVREAAKSADSTLSGLGVDGTPVTGFDPSTLDYTAYLDDMGTLPTVAATASSSKATVAITQATAADPVARVTVTAEDGSTSQYTVAFMLNELKSLTVAGDFRRDYAIGDVFDPTNLRVEGAFSDGSTRDVTAQATFSTEAFDRAGDAIVCVAVGDTVDLSGMRVVATYDDGTEVDVTDDVALSLPDTSRHGTATGTVTYGGASATFTVEVTADPTSLTVQAPDRIVYTVGDPFDATGLRVLATYADGTTDDVTSQARVETPDLSTPGERTVTVLFGGLTAQFTVVVSPDGTGSGTHPSAPSPTDTTSSAPAPAPALKLSDTGSTSAMTLAGGLFLAAAGWSAIRRRRRS
jgi:LPXTG-motif cell wall-anchored protein